MYQQYAEVFAQFKPIHDQYPHDRVSLAPQFNTKGKAVLEVIEKTERELCNHMNKGVFAKYSQRLSEQFREEIKKTYPFIEFIGVEYSS